MVKDSVGALVKWGGMTLAAALMMTTSVFGQDGSGDDVISVDPAVEQEWVGEDNYIGILPPEPIDGGEGDGTGEEWVEDGSGGDGSGEDGTEEEWVEEEWVEEEWTENDWVDVCNTVVCDEDGNPVSDDPGEDGWVDICTTVVCDEDGNPVDDGWVDICNTVVCDEDGNPLLNPWDVEVTEEDIRNFDGGPVTCMACGICTPCDGGDGDLPLEAYQMGAGGNGGIDTGSEAPVVAGGAVARSSFGQGRDLCLDPAMAQTWICEWQNGAGQ